MVCVCVRVCVEWRKTSLKKADHLAGCFVYTFWDGLASQLSAFAFMEVVLRNGCQ